MTRTIPGSIALWAALATAGNWVRLPDPPRGLVAHVSGEGTVVVANGFGGMSIRQPGSTGWKPFLSIPDARAPMVRGGLFSVSTQGGVDYMSLPDTNLFRISLIGLPDEIDMDQDGHRIVIAATQGARTYSRSLFLSVDSATGPWQSGIYRQPDFWAKWRPLRLPPPASGQPIDSSNLHARIEGRLVVAAESRTSWISRDTGATWSEIPHITQIDMKDDTIVGKWANRLYVSLDAGRSWDSSVATSSSGPLLPFFLGGRLYAKFQLPDTTYELSTTDNFGKTWNTVLGNVPYDREAAWDGTSLWAISRGRLLRSDDNGRTWKSADSGIAESHLFRARSMGSTILALQEGIDPNETRESRVSGKRLWAFESGRWRLLRDSIVDMQVLETPSGPVVHVLVGDGDWMRWNPAVHLERTSDLATWKRVDTVKPVVRTLGLSPRGVMVGEADRVAILGADDSLRIDTAWGAGANERWGIRFLVDQDGHAWWGYNGGIYTRRDGARFQVTGELADVRSYTPGPSSTGFRWDPENGGRRARNGLFYDSPYLMPCVRVSGAAVMGDSMVAWYGQETAEQMDLQDWLLKPDYFQSIKGPPGEGIAELARVPRNAVSTSGNRTDSVLLVADLHGRLWWFDPGTTTGTNSTGPRAAGIAARGRSVVFEVPAAGRVRVEVRDAGGRLLETPVDGRFEAGSHSAQVGARGGLLFASLEIDGIRRGSATLPPVAR